MTGSSSVSNLTVYTVIVKGPRKAIERFDLEARKSDPDGWPTIQTEWPTPDEVTRQDVSGDLVRYNFAHSLDDPNPGGWLEWTARRYPELAFDYIETEYQNAYAGRAVIRRGRVVWIDGVCPSPTDHSWLDAVGICQNQVARWEAEAGWSMERKSRPAH